VNQISTLTNQLEQQIPPQQSGTIQFSNKKTIHQFLGWDPFFFAKKNDPFSLS